MNHKEIRERLVKMRGGLMSAKLDLIKREVGYTPDEYRHYSIEINKNIEATNGAIAVLSRLIRKGYGNGNP